MDVSNFTCDELEAYAKNDATYMHYLKRLVGLALSVMKINNLPEEIPERAVKMFLLFRVAVAGATDDVTGKKIILPVVPNQRFDMYRDLTKRIIYSPYTSFRMECDETNSAVIFDNEWRMSILPDLAMYAQRLAEITRGIDVNIKHQKTPYIISTTKRGKATLEEIYRKADANVPVIFADKAVDVDTINTFPTAQPFQAEQMWDLRTSIWNDALTFIGVKNSATNPKRERLVADEVDANASQIGNHLLIRFKSWTDGFEELNKLWGTNIEVELATEDLKLQLGEELAYGEEEMNDVQTVPET